MNFKKIVKKAFLISIAALSTILIVCGGLIYFYQDKIIERFIQEANQHLNTPVHVDKISASIIESFPVVNISFKNLTVEGSLNESKQAPLLTAKELNLRLDPISILSGNFTIEGVRLKDATCYMKVGKNSENNYQIVKKNESRESDNLSLELSKIVLQNVKYIYESDITQTNINVFTSRSSAQLILEADTYYVTTIGDYLVDSISVKQQSYLINKKVEGTISLAYNNNEKSVEIEPSQLKISKSDFVTYGSYKFKGESPEVKLYLDGEKTTLGTISELLPNRISNRIKKYKSKGEAYFNLAVAGNISKNRGPELSIEFGLDNATIFHPESHLTLKNTKTEGFFTTKNIFDISTGTLEFSNFTAELEERPFKSHLLIKNFNDPILDISFTGELSFPSLNKFVNLEGFNNTKGIFDIDLQFKGSLDDLKSKSTADKIRTNGQIEFKNLSLEHDILKYPLKGVDGALLFNNSNVALSDVSGTYGSSDFLLNGFFKNLFAYLLFNNEPIGIEAKLKSKQINLNELLQSNRETPSATYSFKLSPRLRLKFDCDISKLHFRRFSAINLKGGVIIKNEQLQTDNISFIGLGGQVELSGYANTSMPNKVATQSNLKLTNVNIDSAFYVFENFSQAFIEDKNLRGTVTADVSTTMEMDSLLNLNTESLESTINMTIKDGQLNNFEPLQELSKYVDEEKLSALRFSEINTEVFIKNKVIYLPEIELTTNITKLKISGTHGFNQQINYKVATPLRRKEKVDRDEIFGAIEKVNNGETMLYLKITGTTDDYDIAYDKEEVKKKIISDLKKEVLELKKAFKEKGLKKDKKVELEEDDYFDW